MYIVILYVPFFYRDHNDQYMETTTHSVHNRFSLADLAFNADYEVKIRACGILPDSIDPVCGDWGAKKYHTGIGASGAMPAPKVTFINSTEVEVRNIFLFLTSKISFLVAKKSLLFSILSNNLN